jgi:F0F1-type ATP synthase assembly protein I
MALRRNTPAAPPATGRGNAAGTRGAKAPSGAKAAPKGTSAGTGRGARAGGKDPKAPKTPRLQRAKQIVAVFRMTQQRDPKMLPWLLLALLAPLIVGIVLGILLGSVFLFTVLGLIVGLFLGLNVFSRRVQKTAYAEIEGKPGAAAGVIERMRGDWRLTAPVQVNRNQDLVSRVVCRAGVVLIAEGRGRGPRDLLGAEVRRVKKVIGDAPLHDIIVGNGPGEVPLPKLQNTLMRKPRVLKQDQVNVLDRRLKALGGVAMPLPKGPIPRNVPRSGKMR